MIERAERRKGSFYVLVDLSAPNLSAPPKKAAVLSQCIRVRSELRTTCGQMPRDDLHGSAVQQKPPWV
jgi:hypothetical protein